MNARSSKSTRDPPESPLHFTYRRMRRRRLTFGSTAPVAPVAALFCCSVLLFSLSSIHAFSVACARTKMSRTIVPTLRVQDDDATRSRHRRGQQRQNQHPLIRFMYAPPGSGYAQPEDYPKSELPDTYEPMMAYPGTMRPGKTPENMPFQDLPIGDNDPDNPVPWPHFQQIEWHHRWSEPPHPHPGTMEDFIESLGRWATPEQEAAMRTGVRRDVRQRQEQAESEKRGTIITDDDEDEDFDDEDDGDESVALGDGIYGKLGSDADRASTAAAVSPTGGRADADSTDEEVFASDGLGDDLDDFLLDLGLDAGLDDDESEGSGVMTANVLDEGEEDEEPPMEALAASTTSAFGVDDDSDDLVTLGLDGDDDEDELEGAVNTVPLEDFGDSDNLDVEDIFDEGGFDYDDGDFGGGGDVW